MQLTVQNVRAWAKATGYQPSAWSGARTLRFHIHDESCRTCPDCQRVFTWDAEGSEDGPDGEWLCRDCFDEWEAEWGDFDARREWGTY